MTYLRGTLTIRSADNPAANLIGGYKSLTSAFRKCRTCMTVESDMQTKVGFVKEMCLCSLIIIITVYIVNTSVVCIILLIQFHESEFILRTRETHSYHCSSLDGPLHDHMATAYGITCNSVLNSSRFFHVVDGLIPDVMHVILEGTLQLHLKWLLRYLIRGEELFSLETLNHRIQSFKYGQADSKNKPTIISHETLSSSSNSVIQLCKSYFYLACSACK